jgi:hypothetical protein
LISQRRIGWIKRAVGMRGKRNAYNVLVGKSEEKRPYGKPTLSWIWEDNIKLDFEGREWEGMDWIHLAEDRDQWGALVNTVMNLRVP